MMVDAIKIYFRALSHSTSFIPALLRPFLMYTEWKVYRSIETFCIEETRKSLLITFYHFYELNYGPEISGGKGEQKWKIDKKEMRI